MNATYTKVVVTVHHNGQFRNCHLHVVHPEGKAAIYFLTDFYGWAIDGINTVTDAIGKYRTGNYTEVKD
jgi:hypothetical protein